MFNLFKINEIFSDKNNNKKKKKNIFASKANNRKKNHDKAIIIEKIFKGETNSKANNKKKIMTKKAKLTRFSKVIKLVKIIKILLLKKKENCPMPSPSSSFQGFLGANSLPLTKNI